MEFAAITSVDDDVNTKQAIQQSGSKIRFTGIEFKVQQLKERGIPADGIEIWRHLWDRLDAMAQGNEQYKISFAKTACSFNEPRKGNKEKQQIYVGDPKKTSLGYGWWVKRSTGKTEALFERLKSSGIDGLSAEMGLTDGKDLWFSVTLGSVIGKENFKKVIDLVLDELGYP
jgi:hypothetical protein